MELGALLIMQQAVWRAREFRDRWGRVSVVRSSTAPGWSGEEEGSFSGQGPKKTGMEVGGFKQPQGCQENPFTDARTKVVFDVSAHTATLGCLLSTSNSQLSRSW